MKKLIIASMCFLMGTGMLLASSGEILPKIVKSKKMKNPVCRVSCSYTITDPSTGASITYTASAGNFLTNCGSAVEKCDAKIKKALGIAQATDYTL